MELEKVKKTELAKFDPIRTAVKEISTKLKGFVITDNDTRERLFSMSRDANGIKNQVDAKRKELIRPLKADKKNIKEKYSQMQNDEISPIDELIKALEDTAQSELLVPIERAISKANDNILAFDKIESDRREKERLRLEEENKKAEEARKKKLEAEEKIERERVAKEKADAEKKREAEGKTGIQAKLAAKEAEDKKIADEEKAAEKRKADDEAEEKRKADFKKKTDDLAKKSKGSVKYDYSFEVTDSDIIPHEFLIIKVDVAAVEKAQKDGVVIIPGLKLTKTERLGFR